MVVAIEIAHRYALGHLGDGQRYRHHVDVKNGRPVRCPNTSRVVATVFAILSLYLLFPDMNPQQIVGGGRDLNAVTSLIKRKVQSVGDGESALKRSLGRNQIRQNSLVGPEELAVLDLPCFPQMFFCTKKQRMTNRTVRFCSELWLARDSFLQRSLFARFYNWRRDIDCLIRCFWQGRQLYRKS